MWVIKYRIIPAHTHTRKLAPALAFNDAEIAYYIKYCWALLTRFFLTKRLNRECPRRNKRNCRGDGAKLQEKLVDSREEIALARRGDKKINFAINIDAVQLDLHNWASNRA